ncbi:MULTISPECIES: DUF3180 domain-containing protein [Arthrobacter]|uniref:DUF3180 domain-containing protein n=2 Tax=Arthrobacter TaxID=1663 RepID=A0ABU9KJ07_9MICC|nr:DUF3180 domain-containing protein [Arthrobacter sp. YJM1]MDP5226995.1 DUF3180 domain-containing protein [Arthrobacter sp. YJM1]
MRLMRPGRLVALGVIFLVIGYLMSVISQRYSLAVPVLPVSALFSMLAMSALIFAFGWRVHRWKTAKVKKHLDPIVAARTLVLAQAGAYAGTVLFGWHLGIVLEQLQYLEYSSAVDHVVNGAIMCGGGAVMLAVGLIVERFCRIPPEDDGTEGKRDERGKGTEGEYA